MPARRRGGTRFRGCWLWQRASRSSPARRRASPAISTTARALPVTTPCS